MSEVCYGKSMLDFLRTKFKMNHSENFKRQNQNFCNTDQISSSSKIKKSKFQNQKKSNQFLTKLTKNQNQHTKDELSRSRFSKIVSKHIPPFSSFMDLRLCELEPCFFNFCGSFDDAQYESKWNSMIRTRN